MKASFINLLIIALLLACMMVSVLMPLLIVPSTALWAAVDSWNIQLKRYKSGISYGPVALFFGVVLLWIIAFPWYLVVRHKIKTGTAVLKDEATNVAV